MIDDGLVGDWKCSWVGCKVVQGGARRCYCFEESTRYASGEHRTWTRRVSECCCGKWAWLVITVAWELEHVKCEIWSVRYEVWDIKYCLGSSRGRVAHCTKCHSIDIVIIIVTTIATREKREKKALTQRKVVFTRQVVAVLLISKDGHAHGIRWSFTNALCGLYELYLYEESLGYESPESLQNSKHQIKL